MERRECIPTRLLGFAGCSGGAGGLFAMGELLARWRGGESAVVVGSRPSLAEALDMQPLVMPEDGHTTRVTSGEDAGSSTNAKESSPLEPIWDDDDRKAFYECLPNLRASICSCCLIGRSRT